MIENKSKIDILRVVVILAMVAMLFFVAKDRYNSSGWDKKYIYENWEFYDYQSINNGMNCKLDDCRFIETIHKTQVKECICKGNGEPVRIIATMKRPYEEYTKFTKLEYEVVPQNETL